MDGPSEGGAGGIGMSKDPRLARLQKLRMRTESMEMVLRPPSNLPFPATRALSGGT